MAIMQSKVTYFGINRKTTCDFLFLTLYLVQFWS